MKKKLGARLFLNNSKNIKNFQNTKKDPARFLTKSFDCRNCISNVYNFYRALKIELNTGSLASARVPSLRPTNKINFPLVLPIVNEQFFLYWMLTKNLFIDCGCLNTVVDTDIQRKCQNNCCLAYDGWQLPFEYLGRQ